MSANSVSLRARALVALAASAALIIAAGPWSSGANAARGHAARVLRLNERASLHRHDVHGLLIKEEGFAKGTLSGPIYLQLRVASNQRTVSANVQVYPSGGSLSGSASASYRIQSTTLASFSGHLNITSGKGRYAKAHASGLSFSGTIRRTTDAVTVYVSGNLSY
ncbi:MAG TPA: hypothetical protein VIC05_12060 [Solirubrobacteraceae bacterium]|jgi:hypothetical protein